MNHRREDIWKEIKSQVEKTSFPISFNGGLTTDRLRKKISAKMDLVFERCLATDTDFPLCHSPVWVFGRSFSINYDLDELRRHVITCLWITYRKNFPPIGDTNITSDRGWGCMIRAGQMVMGKALLLRHLGHDWHWDMTTRSPSYLRIVSIFADTPTAPLSLHQVAETGAELGKPVGSWLGPNTVAQAFKRILSSPSAEALNLDIELFISMDSMLVKSEVKSACLGHESTKKPTQGFHSPRTDPIWKPLLLIVPLRLGLSDLNPDYVPAFRAAFEVPQNVGMLGGRPNSALYFIGYADEEVLFLDPHTVQPTMIIGSKIFETEKAADETYHVRKPGRMPFAAMDPSIAVCFFCNSEAEFDSLCNKLTEKFQSSPLPLFEICDRRPLEWSPDDTPGTCQTWKSPSHGSRLLMAIDGNSSSRNSSEPDEEFEILG